MRCRGFVMPDDKENALSKDLKIGVCGLLKTHLSSKVKNFSVPARSTHRPTSARQNKGDCHERENCTKRQFFQHEKCQQGHFRDKQAIRPGTGKPRGSNEQAAAEFLVCYQIFRE